MIAIIGYLFNYFKPKHDVYVTVRNAYEEEILRFNISEDNYYEIEGQYGKFHIEVKDGKCRAIDVDCPNQVCVNTGWISVMNNVPIICLPNGIMVMLDE